MTRIAIFVLSLALGCNRGPQSSGQVIDPEPAHDEHPSAHGPGPEPETEPSFEPAAGGIAWRTEAPFVQRRPDNMMRAAEYGVREFPTATLSVFHFQADEGGGGDTQGNIDRWLGQFTQPDGRPTRDVAHIETRHINELDVTLVDASGTFVGRMGMGPPQPPQTNWRLRGAIVQGPNGLVFFKLTGPADAIASADGAFDHLVASLHHQ